MSWRHLSALAALATLFPTIVSAREAATRPNVLVILADDQRFDTIRALGNAEIETPNLDALVARGLSFRNAYCMGGLIPAVCAPSRTMFMTGRTLFRIPAPNAPRYDGPTLGSLFRDAGYATLFVGKRGNTFRVGNNAFETVIHHEDQNQAKRAGESKFMADQTIEWLRGDRRGDRPFLIYLGPPVPHDPRVAPAEYMARYNPDRLSLAPNFLPVHPFDNGELRVRDELLAPFPRTPERMRKELADYYACVTWLDHNVGRIVEELKAKELLDNTLIVFSSDQGLAVGGRHGLMGKQNLYEEFKSPLILAGPGVPKGSSDALVYLHDVLPTLCDLSGIPTPASLEGKSLKPLIQGDAKGVRQVLFGAYRDVQRMVRDERWKLLWYPKIKRFQLFDLTSDPWEVNDLAADPAQADRLRILIQRLAEEQARLGDDRVPSAAPSEKSRE
jgi:arylsulfatase A-like enzyme